MRGLMQAWVDAETLVGLPIPVAMRIANMAGLAVAAHSTHLSGYLLALEHHPHLTLFYDPTALREARTVVEMKVV